MSATTHKITIDYTWSVADEEIDLRVTCDYWPATPDVWYLPNGDPGYPGEPAGLEVLDVVCVDKNLTDDQRRIFAAAFHNLVNLSTLLREELLERCGEQAEPDADMLREQREERELERWEG